MKKKKLVIEAVALMLGTLIIAGASAQTININSIAIEDGICKENEKIKDGSDPSSLGHTIDYFKSCAISGHYSTKNSNGKYKISVQSDTESIIVKGLAVVLDAGDIPQTRYCYVKTNEVKTNYFEGKCSNGYIRGKGSKYVLIGDYHDVLIKDTKNIPKYFNLGDLVEIKKLFKSGDIEENTKTEKENKSEKTPYFGIIWGHTVRIIGRTTQPTLCLVTVKSKEAKIFKTRISFGIYVAGGLPLGYTYTVTAVPFGSAPTKTVTLTTEDPIKEADFGFENSQNEIAQQQENNNSEEEKITYGSIFGASIKKYGSTAQPALCLVTVKSGELRLRKTRVSFGFYYVGNLPLGYSYTVIGAPLAPDPIIRQVTLTEENPNVQVNIDF